RRDILKDLLEVGIYERIMQAANQRATEAKLKATNIEQQLRDDYADATPEALAACREDLARVIPALASAKQQRDALSIARDCANTLVGARNRARECAKQREQTLSDLDIAEELGRAGREQLEALRSEYAGAEGELKDLRYDGELHRALELARDRAKQIEQA